MEKTGTTTIQEFLFQNRNELLEQGLYFPVDELGKNNRAIFDLFSNSNNVGSLGFINNDVKRKLDLMLKCIFARDENIILTTEYLSSRLYELEDIKKLKDYLLNFKRELIVIVYIREPTSFFESSYQECCKDIETMKFNEFVDKCLNDKHELKYLNFSNRYDYESILAKWRNVFGRIIVKKFEPNLMVKNDLLFDFASTIDIDDNKLEIVSSKNTGLTLNYIIGMRIFNRLFKKLLLKKKKSSLIFKVSIVLKTIVHIFLTRIFHSGAKASCLKSKSLDESSKIKKVRTYYNSLS